jgi:hypothetical protein
LRRCEPRAIEISHGFPHIGQQGFQLGCAEFAYRLCDSQEPGIAHFENFAYCHGS